VLAAVIPVVAGFLIEGIPQPLVLVGIVVAVVAVVLVSRVGDETGGRSGLMEALTGGTAIGLFGVAIAQLSPGDVFADLAVIRLVQGLLVAGAVLLLRAAWRPGRSWLLPLVLIGILDTAGNGFYLAAVQTGQLAIASVLSAMYPVVTVVLAAVVLRERVTRDHTIGIVLAGAAIALIGFGGA
jgi:drug/metabolite transporter (DMT)-like permease